MPPEAAALIRENLEWSSPSSLVGKIQSTFPAVSAVQVHSAWTTMSETLWKRDKMQLPSVKVLLTEYKNDVDVFEIPTEDGIEQVAWGMRKIAERLQGKVAEIGMDATCKSIEVSKGSTYKLENDPDNTNSKHLELYTVLGEYDNAGFPLSYCLLSTASSIETGKRIKALEAWATVLREKYNIIPKFVHTDKDMAEISTTRKVWWEAKIQLCWWHLREAVRKRLKGKLNTSKYNILRARSEFPFIDPHFTPRGRPDETDLEHLKKMLELSQQLTHQ
jgi:hypothetical protein